MTPDSEVISGRTKWTIGENLSWGEKRGMKVGWRRGERREQRKNPETSTGKHVHFRRSLQIVEHLGSSTGKWWRDGDVPAVYGETLRGTFANSLPLPTRHENGYRSQSARRNKTLPCASRQICRGGVRLKYLLAPRPLFLTGTRSRAHIACGTVFWRRAIL